MAARADDHAQQRPLVAARSSRTQPGRYVYAIEAWTDEFATWRHGFELKQKAGADSASMPSRAPACSPRRRRGGTAAAAVIVKQCEEYLQTGDAAPLLGR